MQNLKYLAAYIIPFLSFVALNLGGFLAWSPLIFAFVFIPIVEPFLSSSIANYSKEEEKSRLENRIFDLLLYLNLPIIYLVVVLFLYNAHQGMYSGFEAFGLVLSLGTLLGACGINVAHELGHRQTKVEQWMSKLLLLPSLYMHFFAEHNRGHHKLVATPKDPASAKFRENLYVFWIRSTLGGYLSAWQIENSRLRRKGKSILGLSNEMIQFTFIQLSYLLVVGSFAGIKVLALVIAIAVVSFLLLETINYVEHYGLQRKRKPNGKYERVQSWHSWNSNHQLGRIVLYELTRHSHHHFIASKKYQILAHHNEPPQLPFGYPTSMLLSMIPPLWFRKINPEVERFVQKSTNLAAW